MNTVSMKAAILMAALFSIGVPVSVVQADDLSVEERLAKLERLDNSRNLMQIEMQQQIDALSTEVRQLRGSLEEANYKLQQATERQKGLYQDSYHLAVGLQHALTPQWTLNGGVAYDSSAYRDQSHTSLTVPSGSALRLGTGVIYAFNAQETLGAG